MAKKMTKNELVAALLLEDDIGYTEAELTAMTNKELGSMLQANSVKPVEEAPIEEAPIVETHPIEAGNFGEVPVDKSVETVKKEPKVSAKQKAYDLFKANEAMKSSELLDLVCNELSMDRKVASSYLCYYRRDFGIQAQRGLSKEEKLMNFINDQFSVDLTEGQMKAILSTINED